jgi:hypothetical protein
MTTDEDTNALAARLSAEVAAVERQIAEGAGRQLAAKAKGAVANLNVALQHVRAEVAAADAEAARFKEEEQKLRRTHLELGEAAFERVVTAFEALAAAKQAVKKIFTADEARTA